MSLNEEKPVAGKTSSENVIEALDSGGSQRAGNFRTSNFCANFVPFLALMASCFTFTNGEAIEFPRRAGGGRILAGFSLN
jgi:hypothetical protein